MFGEKFKNKLHHPWVGGGIGGVFLALVGIGLLFVSFGKGLEDRSYDLSFLFRSEQSVSNVVLVDLGQDSYSQLNQSREEFDRALHAQLVERLRAGGAKLAVFDILFIDQRQPKADSDRKLVAAMRAAGNVVIAAELHYNSRLRSDDFTFVPPLDLFRAAATGMGVASIDLEADLAARAHHRGLDLVPSLAWKAAELAGAEVTRHPESRTEPRWLNYYAPKPFPQFSFTQVLSNDLPADFSFRDKIVFIGSGRVSGFTGEEREQVRNPWTWHTKEFAAGMEIHALTFANLLRQDWFRRWPAPVEALLVGLTGLLLGFGVSRARPLAATGMALGAAALVAALSLLVAPRFNLWFPWLIVVGVQVPIALLWSYLIHSLRAYVESKLLHRSLELYLSPKQVKEILKRPELLKPGAAQKTVSILFSDIASFSKISERMHPDDLVKLLNDYYEAAIGCVHETDGTVMNLIGDAIFAIWNAPQEQGDHQGGACRAALLLHQALIKFESASLSLPLNTRVGLHTGIVCVGNIGSSTRFEYTAIGESVNMAARLEGLNKQLGTNILATRDIQKTVGDTLVTRLVGHFKFKGFDQVVEIHEMVGLPGSEAESLAWRQSFAAALSRYQRKAFAEAEEGFRKTLELRPTDGPSKFYLERVQQLKSAALPSDWFGEVDLREK